MDIIQRLSGTTDLGPSDWKRVLTVQAQLRTFLSKRGYQIIATPMLEQTELFLRKSGGELAAKMYTFTDPSGRRVSLRPEFTSSVVRAYVEGSLRGRLPLRWQYSGTVFRYEPDQESTREYSQLGAEIIGAGSPEADAEIIALAAHGLTSLGVSGHRLRIGHLAVINGVFEALGLSERARVFVLSNLGELAQGAEGLERVRQRATALGLLNSRAPKELTGLVKRLGAEDAQQMIEGFLADAVTGPTGQRTPEEVMSRYLRKLQEQEDPAQIERALEIGASLSSVTGAPGITLGKLRRLLRKFKLNASTLEPVEAVLDALTPYQMRGVPVTLDVGMARGIAYYSGVVFEIEHPRLPDGISLGGGGRYNGLVKALGGRRDVPALGFAYGLDRVLKVLPRSFATDFGDAEVETLVVPVSSANGAAVEAAERLRADGVAAELDVLGHDEAEAMRYALQKGIRKLLLVKPDGTSDERQVR
jgi:histidyl-tRNA synthetase